MGGLRNLERLDVRPMWAVLFGAAPAANGGGWAANWTVVSKPSSFSTGYWLLAPKSQGSPSVSFQVA